MISNNQAGDGRAIAYWEAVIRNADAAMQTLEVEAAAIREERDEAVAMIREIRATNPRGSDQ